MSKSGLSLLTLVVVIVAVLVAVGSGALSGARDLPRIDGPITDPIPAQPIVSDLALTLQEFVTMPRSDPPPIDDPRVKMYLIEGGAPRQATVREYLDVTVEFSPDFWSGSGLGSGFGFVTFHPDFAKNGKFYTVHAEARRALETKTPHLPAQDRTLVHGLLTEWTAAGPSARTFSGTHREVLRRAPTAGGQYGVPSTNPFVGNAEVLAEIYSYGLCDPYRFNWDPNAGNRMLVGTWASTPSSRSTRFGQLTTSGGQAGGSFRI